MNEISQPKNSTLYLIEGILLFILGIVGIVIPQLYTLGAELFIGTLFLVGGLILLFRLFKSKTTPQFFLNLLSAIVLLVVGFLLIAYPIQGIITLTILLTFYFIWDGIVKLILSFQMRQTRAFVWLAISGILSLIIAGIIYSGWPGTALWVLGLLVGVNFLMQGISYIILSQSIDDPVLK